MINKRTRAEMAAANEAHWDSGYGSVVAPTTSVNNMLTHPVTQTSYRPLSGSLHLYTQQSVVCVQNTNS